MVGVDATATRSCFLMLVQLMRSANVTVVFACMSPALEALFRAHKVIGEKDVVIPLLDDALEWCEERVLIRCGNLECIVYYSHIIILTLHLLLLQCWTNAKQATGDSTKAGEKSLFLLTRIEAAPAARPQTEQIVAQQQRKFR